MQIQGFVVVAVAIGVVAIGIMLSYFSRVMPFKIEIWSPRDAFDNTSSTSAASLSPPELNIRTLWPA